MGRPRKDQKDRLTRTITARVSDEQFDWLVEGMEDGEFSAAVRNTIDAAKTLEGVLNSRDPVAALRKLLKEAEEKAGRNAYYDEYGRYPDES